MTLHYVQLVGQQWELIWKMFTKIICPAMHKHAYLVAVKYVLRPKYARGFLRPSYKERITLCLVASGRVKMSSHVVYLQVTLCDPHLSA